MAVRSYAKLKLSTYVYIYVYVIINNYNSIYTVIGHACMQTYMRTAI